jgi:hypothetical protein
MNFFFIFLFPIVGVLHCHTITVRYTTVQLYQSIPLTCSQPVQLPCNQSIPELNMYQQNKKGTRLVVLHHAYVHALSVMQPTYIRDQTFMQLVYALFLLKTYDLV